MCDTVMGGGRRVGGEGIDGSEVPFVLVGMVGGGRVGGVGIGGWAGCRSIVYEIVKNRKASKLRAFSDITIRTFFNLPNKMSSFLRFRG